MIEEIKKFMGLVPLMLPNLINEDIPEDSDVTEDSAILEFTLAEPLNIGLIMDMIADNTDLLLLYNAKDKQKSAIHHCCFFSSPKIGNIAYKINIVTDDHGDVSTVIATIYDDLLNMEDGLEEDLQRHEGMFDLIQAMSATDVSQLFCTIV